MWEAGRPWAQRSFAGLSDGPSSPCLSPARPSEGPVCCGVLFNGTDTGVGGVGGALDEARWACLDQCIDNTDEPGDEYLGLFYFEYA